MFQPRPIALDPERLRPLEQLTVPDERWRVFGQSDGSGEFAPITLERYAAPIQAIVLDERVPSAVVTHFETAKNLALYAWFVYRFIPVAELYAFISVEFALREMTGDKKTPFSVLLKRCAEGGMLHNERFSQWQRVTEQRRRMHEEEQRLAALLERPVPNEPEHWNYVQLLVENVPWFRNTYAHGSSSISPWAYRTLEDCGELINQLYVGT